MKNEWINILEMVPTNKQAEELIDDLMKKNLPKPTAKYKLHVKDKAQ